MRMEREWDPEGTQGGEEPGGAEGGKNIVRIDYVREKNLFIIKEKYKEIGLKNKGSLNCK